MQKGFSFKKIKFIYHATLLSFFILFIFILTTLSLQILYHSEYFTKRLTSEINYALKIKDIYIFPDKKEFYGLLGVKFKNILFAKIKDKNTNIEKRRNLFILNEIVFSPSISFFDLSLNLNIQLKYRTKSKVDIKYKISFLDYINNPIDNTKRGETKGLWRIYALNIYTKDFLKFLTGVRFQYIPLKNELKKMFGFFNLKATFKDYPPYGTNSIKAKYTFNFTEQYIKIGKKKLVIKPLQLNLYFSQGNLSSKEKIKIKTNAGNFNLNFNLNYSDKKHSSRMKLLTNYKREDIDIQLIPYVKFHINNFNFSNRFDGFFDFLPCQKTTKKSYTLIGLLSDLKCY